ncbi:MAG TPA: DUF4328 domain-containing protein [Phenylobacterium sp.]|nr:DUF4328 domain-containing protein [Phenylobacterium sp.]
MSAGREYTFLNPAPLSRTVIQWLWIDLAVSVVGAVSSVWAIAETLGVNTSLPSDTALTSDIPLAIVGLAQVAVFLVTGFLVLKWIYRVSRNAHSAVRGLKVTPPWAVGWYFVPVAFLWKPFEAMRETWQASTDPTAWPGVPVPAMLRWWWGLFLASNFTGQLSFRIALRAGTLGGMAVASGFDLASALISVPLDLIFIRIVRELTNKQVLDLTFGSAKEAA